MPSKKLEIGDSAPDFALPGDGGQTVKLSDLRGQRVILYFYPKDDTPGCTTQACGFRDAYPRIQEHNAVVIGISPDGVASHDKFKARHNLPFALLADEDHAVAQAYGVWGKKSMYGKEYDGILRSHFVIDEQGQLADIQIKVSPQDSVERAVESIQ